MGLAGSILGYIGSGRAAKSISDANIVGEHAINAATQNGQQQISGALGTAQQLFSADRQYGQNVVGDATGGANSRLQQVLDNVGNSTQPYMQAGQTGLTGLSNYANSPDSKFNFNLNDYFNSPAFNFQLQKGQDALQGTMSAQGLGNSGAAGKALTDYGQGLASTYANDAFNRAQSQFQTNQNATLSNMQSLINAGQFGSSQYNNAQQAIGGQQASNTLNQGYYNANANTNMATLLSQMGLQGALASGQMGMQGAKIAGDYAVGAGQAHAGGIMGQDNALAGIGSGIAGLIGMF